MCASVIPFVPSLNDQNQLSILKHITLIFLILAAILHLANIVFMPCEDTDGVSVVDEYPLHAVAKLLGIEDEVQLTEALISNVNYIKGMKMWKS